MKMLEVRDEGTLIPVMGIEIDMDHFDFPSGALSAAKSAEIKLASYALLRRAGYGKGRRYILIADLINSTIRYDPFAWSSRTMKEAHLYIEKHWDDLESGAVIDVEYILGKTSAAKTSEVVGNALYAV